jgi:diguanylate cyclase (GGDEF)-like protein/PAS domain S-box-containing protein
MLQQFISNASIVLMKYKSAVMADQNGNLRRIVCMEASENHSFNSLRTCMNSPVTLALIYFTISSVWIMFSDTAINKLTFDINAVYDFSMLKGMLFVTVTSGLLFLVLRNYMREIQNSRDILQAAFQASTNAICVSRLKDDVVLLVNSGFAKMSGYSEQEAVGNSVSSLAVWSNPADCLRVEKRLKAEGAFQDYNLVFKARDGSSFSGSMSAKLVELNGDQCVISIVRDLSREMEARQIAEKLENYDRETGLPNLSLLLDRLNQMIVLCTREKRKAAVVYVTLTGYQAVVDTIGHNGGDVLLKEISARIVAALRPYDTVARIHRDEFVILLGGSVEEIDVPIVLNKLNKIFLTPVSSEKGDFVIPAAMGVACLPADGNSSDVLLKNAHMAMNQARISGVSSQFYSDSMKKMSQERYYIESNMLRGIEENEFFLCYQPKFAISGKDISGIEALVRWRRPGQGIVPPDKFIGVAEDNGMIFRLGMWVLHEACRQNKAWQDAGLPPVTVSVNISGKQMRDSTFVDQVIGVLESTGLESCYLELELTESVIMSNSEDTVQKLLRLKQYGISISIDDFGTGYSSLSYLKHLPIDSIKVDRSFVRDIVSDSDDAAIVDAIVAVAHALQLKVIAEGVETLDQLEMLRKRNCHEAQGYYFSKPLEAGAFEEFLASGLSSGKIETVIEPSISQNSIKSAKISSGISLKNLKLENTAPVEHIPAEYIADISTQVFPSLPSDNLSNVLKRFQTDKGLQVIPIVEDGVAKGIINRSVFLEEYVIGMHGFAYQINHNKKMRDLMSPVPLVLEAGSLIKDAAHKIQSLSSDARVDNVCITRNGRYEGLVDVNLFISAITDMNLTLAKGANPLTGLPGNESIQREITERLKSGIGFDIAYVDIDNFKPYNDYYGFQKGDVVIKALGEIINEAVQDTLGGSAFCGHIGGDDFIVISGANTGQAVAAKVITAFEEHRAVFHGEKDFSAGSYTAVNRKGEAETFDLISISIGIVNTELTPVSSYAQLASLSTDVKKSAKKQHGSSIVVNRRMR